jgi:tocopherol O-methyltransferase
MIIPKTTQTAAEVGQHYDNLDRFYREIWGEHVHHGLWHTGREDKLEAAINLVELLANRLALKPGETVCDIGCGYGGTSRMFAERWGATVTGVTVSPAQLAYAQQKYPTANPHLMLQDWLTNKFPANSFDASLSCESSEHMVDKQRFFAEVYRTLKPGGRFANCVWLVAEQPANWQVNWLLEPICREARLPGIGSETEYRAFIAEAGLELVSFEDLSDKVWRTWWICLVRAVTGIFSEHSYRTFLLNSTNSDRRFALTLVRMLVAFRSKGLRYGVFVARKPA